MANQNLISTTQALERANEVLRNHMLILDDASKSLNNFINSAKLPSSYAQNLKTQKDLLDATNKSTKQLEKTEKALQRERLQELKLQKKREQAFDKYEKQQLRIIKQAEREQKQIERTQGLYNRVQRGINQATREYNDLAIKRELNGKLTNEELIQLGKLESKLSKYQRALLNVDKRIGKHQRNVGNYASSFDTLGFSVAQITRELPAFANSMQTGFMAISNNIPMLTDEITRLKMANKDLAASGKPTVSIMRQLGKSIFSVQSLISIGVTLLTVYGAKLVEWAFGQSEAEKATEKATKELEEQNAALRENIRLRNQQLNETADFINNIGVVEDFQRILNDVIGSGEDAEAVLSELADRFGKLGVSDSKLLKDQNLLQGDRVRIAFNLLEIEKQQNLLSQERLEIDEAVRKENEILNKLAEGEISQITANKQLQELRNVSLVKTIEIQKRISQLQKNNQQIIGKTVELEDKRQQINSEKENKLEVEIKDYQSLRLEMELQIIRLEELNKLYLKGSKESRYLTSQINFLKQAINGLDKPFKDNIRDVEEWSKAYERGQKMLRRMQQQTDTFLSGFTQDFINSNPLGSFATFFNGTFDRLKAGAETTAEKFAVSFNAIAESAQQTFNFINQLSQSNFDAEYDRLEQQKATSLRFAGENAAGREEIERQYEEKRAEIQRRQAEAQRQQAIFNTVINTAQGVVSALASTPPNVPLSVLVGIIGAAQLAAIKSQQIPQFWIGGEHDGGQLIMNDDPFGIKGSNYKEVAETPSGRIIKPQGKNVKMNLPKGTVIHPTYGHFLESLDRNLALNGISPFPESAKENGLNTVVLKQQNGISEQTYKNGVNTIVKTIKNQTGFVINVDENGFTKMVTNGGAKTKILNRKVHKKARRF